MTLLVCPPSVVEGVLARLTEDYAALRSDVRLLTYGGLPEFARHADKILFTEASLVPDFLRFRIQRLLKSLPQTKFVNPPHRVVARYEIMRRFSASAAFPMVARAETFGDHHESAPIEDEIALRSHCAQLIMQGASHNSISCASQPRGEVLSVLKIGAWSMGPRHLLALSADISKTSGLDAARFDFAQSPDGDWRLWRLDDGAHALLPSLAEQGGTDQRPGIATAIRSL